MRSVLLGSLLALVAVTSWVGRVEARDRASAAVVTCYRCGYDDQGSYCSANSGPYANGTNSCSETWIHLYFIDEWFSTCSGSGGACNVYQVYVAPDGTGRSRSVATHQAVVASGEEAIVDCAGVVMQPLMQSQRAAELAAASATITF